MPYSLLSRAESMPTQTPQGLWWRRVIEIVSDHQGGTFRTVYTVRFAGVVYVLHAFQKKSKMGRETPKTEIELIDRRLREAEWVAKGTQG